jgi:hypothetical protein
MKIGRLFVVAGLLAAGLLSGCAAHSEWYKQGVGWVEWEKQNAAELRRQGFSTGARE